MPKKLTQEQFLERLKEVHGNSITTEDKYQGNKVKIVFRCSLCNNTWYARPDHILRGEGCRRCAYLTNGRLRALSQNYFIDKLTEMYGNNIIFDDYYSNNHTKVRFYCNICNITWYSTPNHILRGHGCPNCNSSSSGEQNVSSILEFNNIDYDPQHNFKIRGKNHRLDFVLKDKNNNWCVIQPDGEQHFKKRNKFYRGTELDRCENKYLPALGIRVLRIPWFWFDLDNTFTLLKEFLGYELKKPDKEYVPAYKRIKDMVYEYLEQGGTKRIAIKYKVSRATVSRNFKNYFGMSRAEYVKLHPEYYVKRSIEHVTRSVVGKSYSGIIVFFSSINSASNWLGIKRSKIDMCLAGKQKTAGGYKWEYAD